ncbi:hypothetical protein FA15DRAFT_708945 [Coprinopsis marcescibilis]|uniref:F-box domain-containing protein n=1 Tax=Coprinopsis marcescibilis TaxID=230819 RepID=A0A5C3KGY3_COPMA|nr:hypothetical protein FA15DRAFT_708945 [Coprinopsis marcescibilis]
MGEFSVFCVITATTHLEWRAELVQELSSELCNYERSDFLSVWHRSFEELEKDRELEPEDENDDDYVPEETDEDDHKDNVLSCNWIDDKVQINVEDIGYSEEEAEWTDSEDASSESDSECSDSSDTETLLSLDGPDIADWDYEDVSEFRVIGSEKEKDYNDKFPSHEILNGLVLSQADVDASRDYVILTGHEAGGPLLHCRDPFDVSGGWRESNFTEDDPALLIFNAIPSSDTGAYGYYQLHDDPSTQYGVFGKGHSCRSSLITFTAYCILRTAAPSLDTQILYRFITRNTLSRSGYYGTLNRNNLIDYGPMRRLASMRTGFPIAEAVAASRKRQMLQVASAKVPISSAGRNIDTLPFDILFSVAAYLPIKDLLRFMSVNRILRAAVLPHVDQVCHAVLSTAERYYLPSSPIVTPDGSRQREDLDKWEQGWLDAFRVVRMTKRGEVKRVETVKLEELGHKAPWLMYRICCSRSPSMRNRRRIWGIAEQMEKLAREQGILV